MIVLMSLLYVCSGAPAIGSFSCEVSLALQIYLIYYFILNGSFLKLTIVKVTFRFFLITVFQV